MQPWTRKSEVGSRVVTFFLGFVLIAAAFSKLLDFDSTASRRIFSPQFASVFALCEVVLGLWLMCGRQQILGHIVALVTFSTFAVVSGLAAWRGEASCNCVGLVTIPPVFMFGFDTIATLLLLVTFPKSQIKNLYAEIRKVGTTVCGPMIVAIILTGGAILYYGSLSQAINSLTGQGLYLSQRAIDLGDVRPHSSVVISVVVRNPTDASVTIIGGSSDCTCVATTHLPATVDPGGKHTIPVTITLPEGVGAFRRQLWLLTDSQKSPKLLCELTATVSGAA